MRVRLQDIPGLTRILLLPSFSIFCTIRRHIAIEPNVAVEVPRPSRICSISHRDFAPNEPFFSVLADERGLFVRRDIAVEHWSGPPEACFGWWKSTAKHIADNTPQRQVAGETLQSLFERLTSQPGEADMLYILTLLMLRRKMLRYEKETVDGQGNRWIEVYSLHTNLTYQVPTAMPNHDRLEVIQQQLAGCLPSP